MNTFSNTTPFIALASIDRLHVLPELLGGIHVAQSVVDECAEGGRILVPDLRSLAWVHVVADEHEEQGIHFHPGLIDRLAQHLGEGASGARS